jgi:TonB family protein
MIMRLYNRIALFAVLLMVFICKPQGADANPKHFAFVNSAYIITVELASERTFIMNCINLSDFVIVAQPSEFIYKGISGRFYIGQVFEEEHADFRGEKLKYSASVLLKSRSFIGMNIIGFFKEQDQIDNLSVRIGSKRFYLQPMEKALFNQLAAKIGDVDLQSPDTAAALQRAGISELGTVKSTDGTSEWDRDWQGLIDSDGVNMAKIIERPEIVPTEEARKTRTYGKVKLSILINRNGGIQDLKVLKGIGHGLDQRAMEGVKNSWIFLPATKNGEVVDSSFSFEVEFPPPAPAKK